MALNACKQFKLYACFATFLPTFGSYIVLQCNGISVSWHLSPAMLKRGTYLWFFPRPIELMAKVTEVQKKEISFIVYAKLTHLQMAIWAIIQIFCERPDHTEFSRSMRNVQHWWQHKLKSAISRTCNGNKPYLAVIHKTLRKKKMLVFNSIRCAWNVLPIRGSRSSTTFRQSDCGFAKNMNNSSGFERNKTDNLSYSVENAFYASYSEFFFR